MNSLLCSGRYFITGSCGARPTSFPTISCLLTSSIKHTPSRHHPVAVNSCSDLPKIAHYTCLDLLCYIQVDPKQQRPSSSIFQLVWTHQGAPHLILPIFAAVPNLFGTMDRFLGQFFHGQGCGVGGRRGGGGSR